MRRLSGLAVILIALGSPAARGADLAELTATPAEWVVTIGGWISARTTEKACYRGPEILADIVMSRLGHCEPRTVEIHGQSAMINAACAQAGMRVSLRSTVSLTGDDAIQADGALRIEGMPSDTGPVDGDFKTTVKARRIGPCAPKRTAP